MKHAKVMSVVLACLMATTALAGCSNSSSKSSSSSGAKTATSGNVVWWGWTPGSPVNEQYITEFNKVYPNIKVTWKQTTVADYNAAIKPALAAGTVDAFEVSAGSANGGIVTYASQAVDLDSAMKSALGSDYKDKVTAATINTMTVNGKLKAIGVGSVYAGNLWINKDLFDKYNVKVPTNLAEWITACQTFKSNGITGFVQGANGAGFDIDTFHAIADNCKTNAFNDAATGKIKWTDASIVKALGLWKDMFSNGIMQSGAIGLAQYPDANNLFMAQKAAMVMMGSWYTMNTLPDTMKSNISAAASTAAPFTMIPINFPDIAGTGKTGAMFGDLDYATAVASASKNIPAATTFAVWLGTSQAGQNMIANSLNLVPSLKSATPDWNSIKLVNPTAQNDVIKTYLQDSVKNGGNNPRFVNISSDFNTDMFNILTGVAGGTITPQNAASQLAQDQTSDNSNS